MTYGLQPFRVLRLSERPPDKEPISGHVAANDRNCEIVWANSAHRFEDALAGLAFDLVLLDCCTPGVDEHRLLQRIRETQPGAAVIVRTEVARDSADATPAQVTRDYAFIQRYEDLSSAIHHALDHKALLRSHAENRDALEEREAQLERVEMAAQVGSWSIDHGQYRLTWSRQMYRIFGLHPADGITEDDMLAIVHPDDRRHVAKTRRSSWLAESSYSIEYRIIVDGEIRWLLESAEPRAGLAGRSLQTVGTVQDITQRIRLRGLAVEPERCFREMIDALPDAIAILDRGGRIIRTNLAWRQLEEGIVLAGGELGEGADYPQACDWAVADGLESAGAAAQMVRDVIEGKRPNGSFEYDCRVGGVDRRFRCALTRLSVGPEARAMLTHREQVDLPERDAAARIAAARGDPRDCEAGEAAAAPAGLPPSRRAASGGRAD